MKKCKTCGEIRNYSDYYLTRHQNPMATCRFCRSEYSRQRYAKIGHLRKEPKPARVIRSDMFAERIERPCAVFTGYLFAGDL